MRLTILRMRAANDIDRSCPITSWRRPRGHFVYDMRTCMCMHVASVSIVFPDRCPVQPHERMRTVLKRKDLRCPLSLVHRLHVFTHAHTHVHYMCAHMPCSAAHACARRILTCYSATAASAGAHDHAIARTCTMTSTSYSVHTYVQM